MVRIGARPEDFVVDEIPLYPPAGVGDHTFVRVEKRLLTTEEVAHALARAGGVRAREVGYAGRKDRVAIARQWLSVPELPPERALSIAGPGLRVLEARRHRHKLRTGDLRGNRFELVVRELPPETAARAPAALAELARVGMPNRFGAQRFGTDADNAALGREILAGRGAPRDRRRARFLLSAFQAQVFNAVLERRPLPLQALEAGDVARVHATKGIFLVEDVAREQGRADRFEVSATGPIFGARMKSPQGAPLARERSVFREFGVPTGSELRPPAGLRLRGSRRPLRVRPVRASCEVVGTDCLVLRFSLPPGSYATVLVETLLG